MALVYVYMQALYTPLAGAVYLPCALSRVAPSLCEFVRGTLSCDTSCMHCLHWEQR